MNITTVLIGLFLLNAVLHIGSFIDLNKKQSPTRWGVLAFVFINAGIAFLWTQNFNWTRYVALFFPLIGGLALSNLIKRKKAGTSIDYTIVGVDIITVGILTWLNFM